MFVDLENFVQQQTDHHRSFAHPSSQILAWNVVELIYWAAKIQMASNVGVTGFAG